MDIVENILKIAKETHTTDQQMVKVLGTHTSKIYDWKVGKSRPSAKDIATLAEYFNVSADYLVGKTDDPTPDPSEGDDIMVLNRAAQKATPEQRKKMAKLLKRNFKELFEDES